MRAKRFHAAALGVAGTLAVTGAFAASHTLIGDYTGLDCTTNRKTSVYAKPFNPDSETGTPAGEIADQTQVHIFRGKQYGKPVAIPDADAEFARIWFEVAGVDAQGKPQKKHVWLQSGYINCGG